MRVPFRHQILNPGEYAKDPETGHFYCCAPKGVKFHGNLANHKIIEHEDGTITVSPSILIKAPPYGEWHGFLVRGVWREL